jgi:hypothetical protein
MVKFFLQIHFQTLPVSVSNTKLKSKHVSFKYLQLPMQSVPITTKVVSLNPTNGKVYLIQHNVMKFVSDLWQVGSFLWVLRFPPPIKLTDTI